ncbi:MAG: transcription elongation factor GreB [Proteobacteria bacterium]|nr:MAG: transcription elongation factor GreB [Pseudomonadota bacterium]
MSKAFTREDDDREGEDTPEQDTSIPAGSKNYITPSGAKRLQDELKKLRFKERPEVVNVVSWAAGNGDRSENGDYLYGKKRLREIDRKIRFLSKRLEAAEVIDPLQVKSDQVLFGATVTIRDEEDKEKRYTIVGIDEADISKGRVSWISPIAKALFRARCGDVVTFRSPKGVQDLEIIRVDYLAID